MRGIYRNVVALLKAEKSGPLVWKRGRCFCLTTKEVGVEMVIAASPHVVQGHQDSGADFPIVSKATRAVEDEQAYEAFVEVWKQQVEQNWEGGYTQMPDEIRHDPTLSPRAKIVYEALLSFMWFKTDKCFPSQKTLAEATGYSRSTVIRALRDLYERGYIERWRRGQGDTNYYFINPLSFVRSFRVPGRGRGVRLQERELYQVTLANTPAPRIPLLLSQKCQADTSGSSNVEQQKVSTCNMNQTNQKKIHEKEVSSNPSTVPSEKGVGEKAIGNAQGTINTTIPSPIPVQGANHQTMQQGESKSNAIETQKAELPGAARAKALEVSKRGKPYTKAEAIAAATGIPAEHLAEMGVAQEPKRQPIPAFIVERMTELSRELGDSPRSLKSNITRATKLYYFACKRIGYIGKIGDVDYGHFQVDPPGIYGMLLDLAKANQWKVTKIRHHTGERINRIPVFFACLENLFGLSQEELAYVRSDELLYVSSPQQVS